MAGPSSIRMQRRVSFNTAFGSSNKFRYLLQLLTVHGQHLHPAVGATLTCMEHLHEVVDRPHFLALAECNAKSSRGRPGCHAAARSAPIVQSMGFSSTCTRGGRATQSCSVQDLRHGECSGTHLAVGQVLHGGDGLLQLPANSDMKRADCQSLDWACLLGGCTPRTVLQAGVAADTSTAT